MDAVGIILEANPFHNGHLYLLNSAKKLFPDSTFVAITSTSFTMRGEISVLDKFSKTKILLNYGFDIVLELPITYTLQSADFFSSSAVNILSKLNITKIVTGSEVTDLNLFKRIYDISSTKEFKDKFKLNLLNNNSHKTTYSNTLSSLGINNKDIELFNKPNATLVFQYYKSIKDNNLNISLHLIKRTNDYYEKISTSSNIASASFIRENLNDLDKITSFIPYNPCFIDITKSEKVIIALIKFQTMSYPNQNPFLGINGNIEGIDNYIMKNADFRNDYNTLINSLKNKKYSLSRIRRILISLLIKMNKVDFSNINYLRILGLSLNGKEYLKTLPKEIKQLIFSSPNELKDLDENLNYEILATKLYGILINDNNFYLNEYKLPIKKETQDDII